MNNKLLMLAGAQALSIYVSYRCAQVQFASLFIFIAFVPVIAAATYARNQRIAIYETGILFILSYLVIFIFNAKDLIISGKSWHSFVIPGIFIFFFAPLFKSLLILFACRRARRYGITATATAVGFAFLVYEYITSVCFAALPDRLYLPLWNQPILIQCASFIGAFGITFLIGVVNYLAFIVFSTKKHTERIKVLGHIAAITCLMASAGAILQQLNNSKIDTLTVNIIQPSISWSYSFASSRNKRAASLILHRLLRLTASAENLCIPRLTIWPEQSVPSNLIGDPLFLRGMRANLKAPLLFGTLAQESGNKFNSVALMEPKYGSLINIRHKAALVPIYESTRFSSDNDYSTFRIFDNLHRVGVLICYESLFPEISRKFIHNGARAIICISNDSVFNSQMWQRLHAHEAIFRAIEYNRYAVHLNNSGSSLICDNHGRIITQLDDERADFSSFPIPLIANNTPFASIGYFLLASIIALHILFAFRFG